jgi:hypothetical protein
MFCEYPIIILCTDEGIMDYNLKFKPQIQCNRPVQPVPNLIRDTLGGVRALR